MTSRSSVRKQAGQLNGKNGCWFVVKAEEKNLLDLDVKWKHKHWQWQRVRSVGNDLFMGETCVKWSWMEGSDTMYGAEERRWVDDAQMELKGS